MFRHPKSHGKQHSETSVFCSSPMKTFENHTLDSGYGGTMGSSRSSILSLSSPFDASNGQGGSVWNTSGTVGDAVNSRDTLKSSLIEETESLYCCTTLPPVDDLPWTEDEVTAIVRACQPSSITEPISKSLTKKMSVYLGRILLRIAREAKRLSTFYSRCGKHEVQSAAKVVLSWSLSEACNAAAVKALSLYNMSSEEPLQSSKSSLCGLRFSVGSFFRWMVDSRVSARIYEHAAIYLTAYMENLLEEMYTRLLASHTTETRARQDCTDNALDLIINTDPELWGLVQSSEHLICGQNAYGVPFVPSYLSVLQNCTSLNPDAKFKKNFTNSDYKALEQCLLTTSVGGISELGSLVGNAMFYLQQLAGRNPSYVAQIHFKSGSLSWEPEALHTLYYYMQGPHSEWESPYLEPPRIKLYTERPHTVQPTLAEWIRVCVAHAEYRHSLSVDSNDVLQAARLMLPGVDCSLRHLRVDCCLYVARRLDAEKAEKKLLWNLAFRMLTCGRTDLVKPAVALLGPTGLDTTDEQGMTPLMYACVSGDEAMVQVLLDSGASVDIQVPSNLQMYPSVHPDTKHWTAIMFAAAFGHISVVQLLLDAGADIEGCIVEGETFETPLKLAVAAGHYELVCLLLSRGADPLAGARHSHDMSTSLHGATDAFSLAAAHGHRNVLRQLLNQPEMTNSSILSLADILAEGSDLSTPGTPKSMSTRSSKAKKKALKEAMFQSSEHGFLDITVELRKHGVPWTLHIWLQSLKTAVAQHRWSVVHFLLKESKNVSDLHSEKMIARGLSILFHILRESKDEIAIKQVAALLCDCYGPHPIPAIPEIGQQQKCVIDSAALNNKEKYDITFLVDGMPVYAESNMLSSASPRFRSLVLKAFSQPTHQVEIKEMSYSTFQTVLQYVYFGGTEGLHINKSEALEIHRAASYFGLKPLKRHCEIICAKYIFPTDAVETYQYAKFHHARELKVYCEGYFLKNMATLLEVDCFRQLLAAFDPTDKSEDILTQLQRTLACRMRSIYLPPYKETTV
ncbi:ankyrin repeat and BTB/POZ domain-containing protein BTBD11-like isoform X2 [Protopterus annectens]|nr:ankyrin repeat and BTB/POZ domain-containing protein BTBD11-like isoform X2 [Protopterus annectens]